MVRDGSPAEYAAPAAAPERRPRPRRANGHYSRAVTSLFPALTQWQHWAGTQRRVETSLRAAKQGIRPDEPPRARLWGTSDAPRVLVVIDKSSASCAAAVQAPLAHLDPAGTWVLAAEDAVLPQRFTRSRSQAYTGVEQLPGSISCMLSLGAYLTWSEPVEAWAAARGIRFAVVQHGLLTPWSPPAPRGAIVYAWSEADAEYWARGRTDLDVRVVGSQLLWAAPASGEPAAVARETPVLLGQLHGTELSRREAFETYVEFARRVPCTYRPHPNEVDVASRLLHRVMRARKVTFDTDERPLAHMQRPVVSIFSTGTLEDAARGIPAWVTHPRPQPWLVEFWDRYEMRRWGEDPTPALPSPPVEPARAIAADLERG